MKMAWTISATWNPKKKPMIRGSQALFSLGFSIESFLSGSLISQLIYSPTYFHSYLGLKLTFSGASFYFFISKIAEEHVQVGPGAKLGGATLWPRDCSLNAASDSLTLGL